MVLAIVLSKFSLGGFDTLLVGLALMIPVTMLLLAWEMNIPRTISLMEVLKIVAVGGLMSLIFTTSRFRSRRQTFRRCFAQTGFLLKLLTVPFTWVLPRRAQERRR